MRLAVVQLLAKPPERTALFQSALHALDKAAETDPAPDLILLPAFCDVPAIRAGAPFLTEPCAGPTVAAIGHRARQWGLFTALGFAEAGSHRPRVACALLDRDGDLRAVQRQVFFDPNDDRFDAGSGLAIANILLGRIALIAGNDFLFADTWRQVAESGAALAICATCRPTSGDAKALDPVDARRIVAQNAADAGVCAAVADITSTQAPACPGMSVIVAADGNILAAAEPGRPDTLFAELKLPEKKIPAGRENTR